MHRLLDDRGSVSVEAALGVSSLVVVFVALCAAMATLAAHVAAADTAGAAARAHAVGAAFEPPRGSVAVGESGGLVTVVATVPAPLGPARSTAVFPAESAR